MKLSLILCASLLASMIFTFCSFCLILSHSSREGAKTESSYLEGHPFPNDTGLLKRNRKLVNAAIGSLAMCVSIELTAIRKSAACVPYSGCEGKNASRLKPTQDFFIASVLYLRYLVESSSLRGFSMNTAS